MRSSKSHTGYGASQQLESYVYFFFWQWNQGDFIININ